jgi:hypothetical protein
LELPLQFLELIVIHIHFLDAAKIKIESKLIPEDMGVSGEMEGIVRG